MTSYNANIPMAKATYVVGPSPTHIVPIAPPMEPKKRKSGPLTETAIQRLMTQGFTRSLAESLNITKEEFALRIWIVDNSGSMQAADGHRMIKRGNVNLTTVDCTRWDEICDCVEYHIRLSSLIEAPTRFRFLNSPGAMVGGSQISIAEGNEHPETEARNAISMLRKVRPGGYTPLTQHIMEIHREVEAMAPELHRTGQRVAITIATDGLPTDERGYGGESYQNEFVESLRLLEGLPVWLVIRLCTDDDDVVDFYNNLDEILELSIDVLDDFLGEAKEVFAENPWLTYSLPLHRVREMGYHDRIFDMIDERKLTAGEMRDFCVLIFGSDLFDGAPHPAGDWKGFTKVLSNALSSAETQWNPISRKAKPFVSLKKLNRHYSRGSCF